MIPPPTDEAISKGIGVNIMQGHEKFKSSFTTNTNLNANDLSMNSQHELVASNADDEVFDSDEELSKLEIEEKKKNEKKKRNALTSS